MSAAILRSEPLAGPTTDGALQRAHGVLDLVLSAKDGRTAPLRIFQESALKVRFPKSRQTSIEAVLLNLAGGLAGGDSMDVRVTLQRNAKAVLTSQACERVYRSLGADSRIVTNLMLEEDAVLDWLPQSTILFDGGRLSRLTNVDMTENAKLLAVESVVFGRAAMQETVRSGYLADAWRIRRGGALIFADTFRIEGKIETQLARPSLLAGARAMATILYVAPDAQRRLEEARAVCEGLIGNSAASSWNGILVIRLTAADSYILNKDMAQLFSRFRGSALPRVWSL